MSKFKTRAVLSASTGLLLCDIGEIYKLFSYLVGRPVFTHELAYYGNRVSAVLKCAIPDLPIKDDAKHVNGDNYLEFVSNWEDKIGAVMDLPDSLRDVIADDRTPESTLQSMAPNTPTINISTK